MTRTERRARVLIPLPDRDFDVTEVAVPWQALTAAGHQAVFATEAGAVPAADPLLLRGVLFGQLGAQPRAKDLYAQMIRSPEFLQPRAFGADGGGQGLDVTEFDGLLLPGGHAPGMRQYLGSSALQKKVGEFWQLGRPVGAICHGVLVLARTRDSATGHSVLRTRKTTCLPKYMERSAYLLTFWKLGRYYRTYPEYVEDEVKAALADPASQFLRGPRALVARDSETDGSPAFVVEDGNYVSARWPGDAYSFAKAFLAKIEQAVKSPGSGSAG